MTPNNLSTETTTPTPTEGNIMPPPTLKCLQFNVWLDATRVREGLELTADAIIDSKADIVSLIEVKNFTGDFVGRLKKALKARGVDFYGSFAGNPFKLSMDADTAILSRYPITEQTVVYRTLENCIVRSIVQVNHHHQDNKTPLPVAVYSVHLEYRSYTCYLPRGYNSFSWNFPGWKARRSPKSWKEMIFCQPGNHPLEPMVDPQLIHEDNMQSGRPQAIEKLMEDAATLSDTVAAVIVMGDFNEPSALDWTKATAQTVDHNGLVYEWDSTRLLLENGYVDSYRELYPNPVTHPGYTWPSAAQGNGATHKKKTDWAKLSDERDRIDFIFYKNNNPQQQQLSLKAHDAHLVGTPIMTARDTLVDESDLPYEDKIHYGIEAPWPSDHRAVLTEFRLVGDAAPAVAASGINGTVGSQTSETPLQTPLL
ncbi:Endonuclease Exonuclease phosphatase [Seminavis robusta]|uniref:Endonuclease Exonuclease phosphatase n=1 Tax=Seminavis robusta TaxID=568900 RepID=A0A9N8DGN3_9STRA|nr:Endonuclease Exonuclease phosphatase [Seminavis robusta]|eukprot:Sro81_g043520.1 Endonuclease Exonuclease phosphatase (425) ;mRNA; r:71075-72349